MTAMDDHIERPPIEERESFKQNPVRVTRHYIPADPGSKLEIIAGWNGNVESYYFVVTWTEDIDAEVKAGDVYHEGGYPLNQITDIADLVEHIIGEVDLSSPQLPAVLYELLGDKSADMAVFHYYANPWRNNHIPELIGKVLDRDFRGLIPPRDGPPRERGRYWQDD
jgi:hypothetical protein